ncbi:hypothetical protein GGI09_006443 [Coemansia sp. S100]|nr:hypothetical protein GGI09_006443 [Coemansia sp. S100]
MTVDLERDFALRDSPTVSGPKIEDVIKAANICIHSYGGHLAAFPDFDENDDSVLDRENYTAHNFVRLAFRYAHTGERMDGQVEVTNKQFQRHKLFTRELSMLMYGFGDTMSPLPESVDVLEDILVDYINNMCVQAAKVSGRKNKVAVEDFKFVLRKDPKKLARVEELLAMNKEIEVARTMF